MSRATICMHAERVYTQWRGLVDLLDMDHVQCSKNDSWQIVPIELCDMCEEVAWELEGITADEWEYSLERDLNVVREDCGSKSCVYCEECGEPYGFEEEENGFF